MCTAKGVPNLAPCQGLKNVAFNIGAATELSIMVLVGKGPDAPNSPVIEPVFGTSDPVNPGQIYGSIADESNLALHIARDRRGPGRRVPVPVRVRRPTAAHTPVRVAG